MPKFLYAFLLPICVLLGMAVIIGIIASLYFLGYGAMGYTGAVVAGLVLTIVIGIACMVADRQGGPRTTSH